MVVCRIQVVAEEVEKAEELDVQLREAKAALRRQIAFYSRVRQSSSNSPRRLTEQVSDPCQVTLTNPGVRPRFASSSLVPTKG
jgi:hypothetical protein